MTTGPSSQSVRVGRVHIEGQEDHLLVEREGAKASLITPLTLREQITGALNTSLWERNRWDTDLVNTLLFQSERSGADLIDQLGSLRPELRYDSALHALGIIPSARQQAKAFGVTYESSRRQRMAESEGGGDFYDKVYAAERPEMFIKAPYAYGYLVGTHTHIHIRSDATRSLPEPELVVAVTRHGKLIGYLAGNDVTACSIEGQNPLYLPQAKTYQTCGSFSALMQLISDQSEVARQPITMVIMDGDRKVWDGATSTDAMKEGKRPHQLVPWLFKAESYDNGVVAFTGTGLIPPEPVGLREGHKVIITVGQLSLENTVKVLNIGD